MFASAADVFSLCVQVSALVTVRNSADALATTLQN